MLHDQEYEQPDDLGAAKGIIVALLIQFGMCLLGVLIYLVVKYAR